MEFDRVLCRDDKKRLWQHVAHPVDADLALRPPIKLITQSLPSDALPDVTTLPWREANTGLELIDILGFSIRSDDENQAVALLSRELSRAAAQGLIEPDRDPDEVSGVAGRGKSQTALEGRSNL